MKKISLWLIASILVFSLSNCSDDDDVNIPLGDYETGVFIINQGAFGQGNSSLSFLNTTTNTITNNIFNLVNGSELGDISQSATLNGNNIYIIVNASGRIVVANRFTLEEVAIIENTTDVQSPRYMAVAGNKGYITDWGVVAASSGDDDFIAVLNLETNEVETKISVPEGPERIVFWNNALYVLQSGVFNQGNTITVIDPNSNTVTDTITVGDVPQSFQVVNNQLYVLCRGRIGADFVTPETEAEIYSIDASNNATLVYDFEDLDSMVQATDLNYANDTFFVEISTGSMPGVYSFGTNDFNGISRIIDQTFYGLTIIDNEIYGMEAPDFTSAGTLKTYNLSGNPISTYTTSIAPSFAIKNE